ncbi:MAG: hypothetical protein EPN20_09945 [Magnetospirillum sp.]|nr:MAG: hypothetical protein EPN20_09945 [Magnetospirillum sp.]
MSAETTIESLRRRHYSLESLPDAIRIPALGLRRDEEVKPTEDATVDDIAFAILVLDAECDAAYSRLGALRKLHTLARQKGALGSDRVVDAIPVRKEGV